MKLISMCAGAALCILASCSEGPTKQMPYNQGINVIPTPVSLVQNEGSFKLSKNTAFSASTPEAKTVAEYFAAQMNLATGYQITVSDKAASNGITLAIDGALDVNNEGYTLDVTPQGVTIKAKTPQGLFYGMQTFMQLLPAEIESQAVVNGIAWIAPCVTVKDEPRFEYRGIMLDPCRHFIPVENVKKHLDVLALFKINRMHWHLTDDQGWRIEIKKYPKLTEIGSKRIDGEGTEYSGFYTQEQIKEVVKYAAERFIYWKYVCTGDCKPLRLCSDRRLFRRHQVKYLCDQFLYGSWKLSFQLYSPESWRRKERTAVYGISYRYPFVTDRRYSFCGSLFLCQQADDGTVFE